MILSEGYKNRLLELAGLKSLATSILEEAAEAIEDLYQNSDKRVKFDQNLMKQAIEGGMEIGMIFQSNISQYEPGRREPPLPILLSYAPLAGASVELLIDDNLKF